MDYNLKVVIDKMQGSEGLARSGEAIALAFKVRFLPIYPLSNPEIEL